MREDKASKEKRKVSAREEKGGREKGNMKVKLKIRYDHRTGDETGVAIREKKKVQGCKYK